MTSFIARINILVAALAVLPQLAAAGPSCGGSDLIAELEREQPARYQRIADEAAETINGEAMLWRITAQSDRAPSYLLGTMHLSDDRIATLTGTVTAVLDEVGTVALEITGVDDKKAMQAALAKHPELIALPAGPSLWDLVRPADRQVVFNHLKELGIGRRQAEPLQPWLPALMLSRTECEAQRGEAGHPVLDRAVEAYAKKRGLRLVGLETPAEQFAAMSSMPMQSQVMFLTDAARMRDQLADLNETMIQLYLARRITWFLPFSRTLAGSDAQQARADAEADFMTALIDKRNVRMAERAVPLLNDGGVLIAVGALHLPGKLGLVALLREHGFELSPVE